MIDKERIEICPYCGGKAYADWVDVGVEGGDYQCSPYVCSKCGVSEIGFHCEQETLKFDLYKEMGDYLQKHGDLEGFEEQFKLPEDSSITQEEFDKGWYKPHSKLSNCVNQMNGKLISHEKAEELYNTGELSKNKLEIELEKQICPHCNSKNIEIGRWNMFSGDDDWFYHCMDCGEIFKLNSK